MKISLRQKGGLFGSDRNVDLSEDDLRVTEKGVAVTERTLSSVESAKVGDVAKRLISKSASQEAGELDGASDSMLTEIEIGDADEKRTYRIRSGDLAPDELWELVGTLQEVADSAPADSAPADSTPTADTPSKP
jgi:hypothetical protein